MDQEIRRRENELRIRKYGSGLTPEEFKAREELIEEGKRLRWANPPSGPVKMPQPRMTKQKIMAELLREESES
jgi:hypothetical protein